MNRRMALQSPASHIGQIRRDLALVEARYSPGNARIDELDVGGTARKIGGAVGDTFDRYIKDPIVSIPEEFRKWWDKIRDLRTVIAVAQNLSAQRAEIEASVNSLGTEVANRTRTNALAAAVRKVYRLVTRHIGDPVGENQIDLFVALFVETVKRLLDNNKFVRGFIGLTFMLKPVVAIIGIAATAAAALLGVPEVTGAVATVFGFLIAGISLVAQIIGIVAIFVAIWFVLNITHPENRFSMMSMAGIGAAMNDIVNAVHEQNIEIRDLKNERMKLDDEIAEINRRIESIRS